MNDSQPKIIKLSIRDFALPCPLSGSIDAYSGFGIASEKGIEIHQQVQRKRAEENPLYEPEVKIEHTFERGGFSFVVEGRMDGLIIHESPKAPWIEEIKTGFSALELYKTLEDRTYTHPYGLQLLTYGYFYHLNHQVIPDLSFYLVSTRNNEARDLSVDLDVETYETWLDLRLDELVKEAIKAEKRTTRRQKIASSFPFPFERARKGQVELVQAIEDGMKAGKRMMFQAPTGLGKTVGVLYPTLKEAFTRGQKVIYVTPKNSQHQVAEDAMERFQETGAAVKSVTITAKSKMCFKAEVLCNPTYCEFAKDYYDKMSQNEVLDVLAKKKKLTAKMFKNLGEKYEMCPFELQLDALPEADAVICDYNYVFATGSALKRSTSFTFAQTGEPNLVIDEAHNLPSRAMGYYSPDLSIAVLEKIKEEIHTLPRRFSKDAEELVDDCINVIRFCDPKLDSLTRESSSQRNFQNRRFEQSKVKIDPDPFIEQDGKLRSLLTRYLESDIEIRPKDPVLKLCFYWSAFTEVLTEVTLVNHPEFFITYRSDGTLKITCCDASKMLKESFESFENLVAFSATLKPFEYYAELSGLNDERLMTAEFESPFEKSKRKLLLIPQISTKYSQREANYQKISEAIERIVAIKAGNYVAFFPSFAFLEQVQSRIKMPKGFRIIRQEPYMNNSQTEDILDTLKRADQPTLLFAVQGGIFSEGVDYPGDMLIGAFVVGPPLPNFDVEREEMKNYYQKTYERGFDYSYTYPAMAKAVQSAGRVIRTENDKGLIVLMDGRFLESSYSKTMPQDWFIETPRELVSNSILKDVTDFWSSHSVDPT